MPRKAVRALVIGMDGTIGKALHTALRARGDSVIGTSRRLDRLAESVYLDLGDPAAGRTALPSVNVAFFCAGMTRFVDCREQPEAARRVNVTGPTVLAARLAREGVQVVLLSTSAVLDCVVPRMSAERMPSPASDYGKLKARAESEFLSLGPEASVVRLTKVLTSDSPLFAGWIAALASNQCVSAFDDLRFSPIELDHAVGALTAIADHGEGGVFQVSGAADLSYFEAARHLARRLGVPEDRVGAASALEAGIPAEEVTAYTSLDTRRISNMCGFVAPDPFTVLDRAFGKAVETTRAGQ